MWSHSSYCNPNLDYLMLKCRLFYLPQEFSSVILITAVYIPPRANTTAALKKPSTEVEPTHFLPHVRGQHTRPSLLHFQRQLQETLHQAPFSKSDHASILLLPSYKQRPKQTSPVMWSIQRWSSQSDSMLQDCFDYTDWNVFQGQQ